MPRRRLLRTCVAASALSVAGVVAYRLVADGGLAYVVWNLFLAWVPVLAALALAAAPRRPLPLQALLAAVWLAFFPNAPYLATDVIHIDPHGTTLAGVVGALALLLAAPAGLLLAFAALLLAERAAGERLGQRARRAAVVLALLATAGGIYLGRAARLNSWDLVVRPQRVAEALRHLAVHPLAHALALLGTLAFTAALAVLFRRLSRRPDARGEAAA